MIICNTLCNRDKRKQTLHHQHHDSTLFVLCMLDHVPIDWAIHVQLQTSGLSIMDMVFSFVTRAMHNRPAITL